MPLLTLPLLFMGCINVEVKIKSIKQISSAIHEQAQVSESGMLELEDREIPA